MAAATERVSLSHYGAERQETDLAKAQRIVREELGCRGWTEQEMSGCAKGHPEKVAMARRLRKESTMSLKWVAQRLHMGSWTYVSNLLRKPPVPPAQPDLFK